MKENSERDELALRCPECGKELVVSLQSLASSGGVVVCPRCLHQYVPEGVDIPEIQPENASDSISPASNESADLAYCHACGKRLPALRLNFCPYCGAKLNFDTQDDARDTSRDGGATHHTDGPTHSNADKQQPRQTDEPATKRQPKLLTPLPFNTFVQASRRDRLPSWKFKLVAWFIIVCLLALAAYLVYAIINLEQ